MSNAKIAPSTTLTSTPDAPVTYPVVSALTAARKARAMTQAELASQAGLSRMTVQRLESSGLDPRLSTLQEMARVLEHELAVIPSHLSLAFQQWLKAQEQT